MVKKTTLKNPLVSIVILNWNGIEDTLKCLDSVKKSTYKNIEIIVVDNGSEEDISALEKIEWITLVKNPENLGFAGGELSAVSYCNGSYLFLLNNDAIIKDDVIEEALSTFSTDKTIAVVGGKSYPLQDDDHESIGFYSYQYVNPISADVYMYNRDDGDIIDSVTVSGSSVMIRVSALEKSGYFDKRFFAYYEETDLFARLLRCGYRVVYNPNVIIWHKDGASTSNKRFMYYYLMFKNQFLFAYKNFDSVNLHLFKKTYWRNFRRSIWILLKDRGSAEAVYKARVRSTLWNILNMPKTWLDRYRNISLNNTFSYSSLLYTQPLQATVIIDGMASSVKQNIHAINQVLGSHIKPSEIVLITRSPIRDIPCHSNLIAVRTIHDKEIFHLSSLAFGFMSSNTDVLIPLSTDEIIQSSTASIATTIKSTYDYITSNESSVVVCTDHRYRSDLSFVNNAHIRLCAIRKSDLVTFMTFRDDLYDIDNRTLSDFMNWVVMDCRPVDKIVSSSILSRPLDVERSSYPVLNSRLRWHVKKTIHALHLARILAKTKKIIKREVNRSNSNITKEPTLASLSTPYSLSSISIKSTPIIINTRDRVEPLAELIQWIEKSGFHRIAFIDNDSTYPELLQYLADTPHQVIPLGRNGMHKSPWESFGVRFLAKEQPYIITDPDILPNSTPADDTVKRLYYILNTYPEITKVGVALSIDDIPQHYSMRNAVLEWESRYWNKDVLVDKDIYKAEVDTTFALYREKTWWHLFPSLRIAGKYTMRHEPWYQDLEHPTDDMMYYKLRASNDVSTWVKGSLPKHHLKALKKEGML